MAAKRDGFIPPSLPSELDRVHTLDLVSGESVEDVEVSDVDLAEGRAVGFGLKSSRLGLGGRMTQDH
jgi:hypothetical protein